MMDIKLTDYQLRCLKEVDYKTSNGAKHLSVVMTTGYGKTTTSFFLAKRIYSKERAKIAMVYSHILGVKYAKSNTEKLGIGSVDCYSVKDFINNKSEYQYVILDDLLPYDRRQMQECLKDTESITISFSTPGQDYVSDDGNRIMSYMKRLPPVVCVYVTNEVFDVRDAKYSGKENKFVFEKIEATMNLLQQERIETVNERDKVKKCNYHLQEYIKAFREASVQQKLKEQSAEIERLKALLQADERGKKIEELEAREAEYQEKLNEKDARIAQQDQMIAFQQEILSSFGIEATIIQDSFEKIQRTRAALQNDLESRDESVREIAMKHLQDKVAYLVSDLTQSAVSLKDQKYFEAYLIGKLTEDVWKKLDDKSKAFLITAKTTYESMIKMKNSETFDYSGICLLVTKALEVETTKRFFICYKDYLERKYSSVSRWPYALRKWNRGQITDNVIDDNEFTLGSVVSVIGLKRDYDDKGNIIAYPVAHMRTKIDFLDYAKNILFKFSVRDVVEKEIDKDYHFIEKVRLDYRNPSAHRDRLTITSAKGCLEYVIDVQHMLKEMLSTMKI